jgi:phenylpyruvate tautomerase PptA (4-oxalocrotonate tautomerase family)
MIETQKKANLASRIGSFLRDVLIYILKVLSRKPQRKNPAEIALSITELTFDAAGN